MVRSSIIILGLVVASSASADPVEEFGARGQLILSADRLSPVLSYVRGTVGDVGDDSVYSTTRTSTSLSLLWSGNPQDFYDIPRVGLDYAVASNFTIGGTAFATLPLTSTRKTNFAAPTDSGDDTSTQALGVGLRGGYIARLTPRVSFWGRAGFSYTRVETDLPQDKLTQTLSQFALSLEPLLVIRAAPHFGVQLGPVIDVPLSGNLYEVSSASSAGGPTDIDASELHIGITAGLLGWF
jgi:hypothetical protein